MSLVFLLSLTNSIMSLVTFSLRLTSLILYLVSLLSFVPRDTHAIFTTSTCSFFDTPSSLTPFLTGTKAPLSDLWFLSLPDPQPLLESPSPSHSSTPSALFSLQSLPVARFVAYWHRCFGSPSLSTFKRALSRGFISMPHLTVAQTCLSLSPSLTLNFLWPSRYPTQGYRFFSPQNP